MARTPVKERTLDRYGRPSRAVTILNVVLALAAASAIGAILLDYGGFRPRPVPRWGLHIAYAAIVAVFVLDRAVRLLLSRCKRAYLRDSWLDGVLIAAAGVAFAVGWRLYGRILSVGTVYVVVTQAYILLTVALRAVEANVLAARSGLPPSWLLIASFAILSLAGAGLLMLPAATTAGVSLTWLDALFTSVSATCVTGLIVRDTGGDFTFFGQAVILSLIQLGGLGIMVFGTLGALLVGKGLGLRESSALGQVVGAQAGTLRRVAAFGVVTTLGLAALGAAGMLAMFSGRLDAAGEPLSTGGALWHGVFHSVSAFCNAGFSLYPDSLVGLRRGAGVLGVFAPLIVVGGLGFPVLRELVALSARLAGRVVRGRLREMRAVWVDARMTLSLHAKLVLSASAALLVVGAAGLLVLERPQAAAGAGGIAELPLLARVRAAAFQSVTARTAGFNSVAMDALSEGGKLWMCLLMVVGGSPASTAGGMKTITVAVLALTVLCSLRRRGGLEAFGRSITDALLRRIVTLAVLYLGLLMAVTLALQVTMPAEALIDVLFEACSACGTVGLSTGVTERLTAAGKGIIIVAMFLGRLGPLTLLLAITARIRPVDYRYPCEDVIIG